MKLKILLILSAILAMIVADSWKCPDATRCPSAYMPVCVDFKGVRRQFHNQCALDIYNCKNGKELKGSRALCPPDIRGAFGFYYGNI